MITLSRGSEQQHILSRCAVGHDFCTHCISLCLAVEDRCPLCRRDHPEPSPAAEVSGNFAPCHSPSAAPASSHQLQAREEDPIPANVASNIPEPTSGSSVVGELHALNHLINSIETVVGCIASVDHQSPAWNAQLSELQDMHMHLTTELLGGMAQISEVWQLKDHIEMYTASVAADFAEFARQHEIQQQQQQQQPPPSLGD